MRLIDADALKEKVKREYGDVLNTYWAAPKDFLLFIDEQPTIDAAPVVHGEWEPTEVYKVDRCTNCGFCIDWEEVPNWMDELSHFKEMCPNCGAKMDGGAI